MALRPGSIFIHCANLLETRQQMKRNFCYLKSGEITFGLFTLPTVSLRHSKAAVKSALEPRWLYWLHSALSPVVLAPHAARRRRALISAPLAHSSPSVGLTLRPPPRYPPRDAPLPAAAGEPPALQLQESDFLTRLGWWPASRFLVVRMSLTIRSRRVTARDANVSPGRVMCSACSRSGRGKGGGKNASVLLLLHF